MEPLNNGHIGTSHFVHNREGDLHSEAKTILVQEREIVVACSLFRMSLYSLKGASLEAFMVQRGHYREVLLFS